METAHLPATPTSPTGPQMPVRVARPCGCARVAQIFVARVVAHICVDAAQVDDVVAMLEQKEVESSKDQSNEVSLVPLLSLPFSALARLPPHPPTHSRVPPFVRQSARLPVCPSAPLPTPASIQPFFHLPVRASVHPLARSSLRCLTCTSVRASVCAPARLPPCPRPHPSSRSSIRPFARPSIHLRVRGCPV